MTPAVAAIKRPYGRGWRRLRKELLVRACYECERCALPDRPMGLRSTLEGAHLDGDNTNDDPDNAALLCLWCHHAHDYAEWARKCHETRSARKDAARPIQWEGAIAV